MSEANLSDLINRLTLEGTPLGYDAIEEIERLRGALTLFASADNWFDTSDEAGGPYPAWRGPSPHDPEGIARCALEGGGEDE